METKELLQQLFRWKAHQEVHARPSDQMLFELLKEIINRLDEKPEAQAPAPPQTPPIRTAEDEGPGGNHPEDPSGNP